MAVGTTKIEAMLEFIIGVVLLPIGGGFVITAIANPNITGLGIGLELILPIGMLVLGFGLIYSAFKTITGSKK